MIDKTQLVLYNSCFMNQDPSIAPASYARRLTAALTLVGAVAFSSTACETVADNSEMPSVTQQSHPAPNVAEDPPSYDELRNGPCLIPQPDSTLKSTPDACAFAERHGRIALVNFDMPPDMAQEVANDAQKGLLNASASMIRAEVTVVPASDQVKQEVNKGGDCVDGTDPGSWPAAVADAYMSRELKRFDFVVSLADIPGCTDFAGIGDNPGKGRHAVADTGLAMYGRTTRDAEYLKEVTTTVVHEVGHLYQWGHAGTLHTEDGSTLCVDSDMVANAAQPLDLLAYASSAACGYTEYGDDSVMGRGLSPDEPLAHPDAIQAYALQRAAQPRTPQTFKQLPGHVVSDEPITFTGADPLKDGFALVQCSGGVLLVDEPSKNRGMPREQIFDSVALVPFLSEESADGNSLVGGANILLYSSYGNVKALIGTLTTRDLKDGASYELKIGDRVVRVTAKTGRLTVEPLAS